MPAGVHFRGVVLGPSGFAAQGREWLAALEAAGLEPSLEGARLGDLDLELAGNEAGLIARCAARPRRPGGVTVHHMLVPHWAPDPRAEHNVLVTLFETEGLPAGWGARCNAADLVVVPTEFNRWSFAAGGVDPSRLVVLPPPFDATPFAPAGGERAPGPFRWLSVFDWSLRKGWDLLLPAFARAFDDREAELWLKVPPDARRPAAELQARCDALVAQHARRTPPRVRVLADLASRARLAALYGRADGFVLSSRGEGWGRPLHEAMLTGLPCVATAGSALRTLLPDDSVGYPVLARSTPVDADAAAETPWFLHQRWQEPDVDHLTARLRQVVDDPDGARRRARAGREHAVALCDRAVIAAQLAHIVRAVPGRPDCPT